MRDTIVVFPDTVFMRNFRYLRQKYRLSRMALACLLDMSPQRIKGMENNLWPNELEMRKLVRLCQIYDMDADVLIRTDLSGPRG